LPVTTLVSNQIDDDLAAYDAVNHAVRLAVFFDAKADQFLRVAAVFREFRQALTTFINSSYSASCIKEHLFIPWLYLRGVSTGNFTETLKHLLGADAPGLSPATISRLKQDWEQDYQNWTRRDLRTCLKSF